MCGKQFAVAILFTVVFLTVAFTPIGNQQDNTYDPWLDYNEDGIIDVNDLYQIGHAYSTSGDTTKNVSVTNWPLDEQGNLKVSICHRNVEWSILTTLSPNQEKTWLVPNSTAGYKEIRLATRFYVLIMGVKIGMLGNVEVIEQYAGDWNVIVDSFSSMSDVKTYPSRGAIMKINMTNPAPDMGIYAELKFYMVT